jgi:hypothetical protein
MLWLLNIAGGPIEFLNVAHSAILSERFSNVSLDNLK